MKRSPLHHTTKKTAITFVYVTSLSPNDDQNTISPRDINITGVKYLAYDKLGTYQKERVTPSKFEVQSRHRNTRLSTSYVRRSVYAGRHASGGIPALEA